MAVSTGVSAQGLRVTPSFSISETLTDNRDTAARAKQADLITQISPGIAITSRSGLLQGSLTYAATGVAYARESSLNNLYHTLAAGGSAQWWDGRSGIDLSASAGRQVISAFGVQSADSSLNTGNQAQVFSYSLSPYLRGRLPGNVAYQARLTYSDATSDADTVGSSRVLGATLGVNGRLGVLGWALDATRQASNSGVQGRTYNSRVGGTLTYTPDIEWAVRVRAGREADTLQLDDGQQRMTWGGGLTWQPGPRTTMVLDLERRLFGRSHSFSFSHRMARTIWTLSDSRGLERGLSSGRAVTSLYDQFFALFASVEPDPIRRDVMTRAFLVSNGLDANTLVATGGFLSGSATVQRQQLASMAYQGLRATFTVSWSQSNSRPVGEPAVGGAAQLDGAIRQQGLTLGWSHRLTADSTVAVGLSQQRTLGDANRGGGNDLRSLTATWNGRLGPRSSVSLGLRHSSFDSDTNPYSESAILGSIRMQF